MDHESFAIFFGLAHATELQPRKNTPKSGDGRENPLPKLPITYHNNDSFSGVVTFGVITNPSMWHMSQLGSSVEYQLCWKIYRGESSFWSTCWIALPPLRRPSGVDWQKLVYFKKFRNAANSWQSEPICLCNIFLNDGFTVLRGQNPHLYFPSNFVSLVSPTADALPRLVL